MTANADEVRVETNIDGKSYVGTYEIADGMIFVHYAGKTKSTQVGGTDPDVLARMILGEMVRGR